MKKIAVISLVLVLMLIPVLSAGCNSNGDNDNRTDSIVADFIASPNSGTMPLDVHFTDKSTGDVTAWEWDFDNDGTPDSAEQNPDYTYNTEGTYTVSLKVTGPDGSDTEAKTDYIVASTTTDFTASPTYGGAPLEVHFSDQSTGEVTAWEWDFNNDSTPDSTEQNPTYTYTADGTYTVSLTVTRPDGSDTEVKTDYIVVSTRANFAASPTYGGAPLEVHFTDKSTGEITAWEWDFDNDSTPDSTEQNPTYTYMTDGTYTVSLTVTRPDGSDAEVKTDCIVVSTIVNFTATPTSGYTPLEVHFTDQSTGDITAWEWDFGDGGTSTEQNPIYTYMTYGTYTVSLTVTRPDGSETEVKTDYIVASTTDFTASQTYGVPPFEVQFTDQSTGDITAWEWDFGDGGTSTEQNPSYTYTTVGTYTVTLEVTGPGGSDTEVKTDFIHVGTIIWTLNTYSYEGQTRTEIMEYFADRVEELSEGRMQIRVATNGEIVTSDGIFDAVSSGDQELGFSDVGKLFEKIPKYAMTISQLWGDTVEERIQYFDAVIQYEPIAQELNDNHIMPLFYVSSGYLEWYFQEPVTTIDEMAGHSLFSAGGAVDGLILVVGSTPRQLDVSEVAQALQAGYIDGVGVIPFDDYYNAGLYELLPYALLTYGLECPFHVLMNKNAYDGLEPELQDIVMQAAAEAQEYGLGLIAQDFEDAKNALIANPDVTINELSLEEQAQFKALAEDVFQQGLAYEFTVEQIADIMAIVDTVTAQLASESS